MKRGMLLLTMQMVATMKIFIVYLGIHEFDAYFNTVNILFIAVYTVLCMAILITALFNKCSKFITNE